MSYQKRISSLIIVLLLLSGCSWLEDWSPRKKNEHVSSSAPLPGKDVEVVSTAGGTWLEAKQNEQKNMRPHVISEETTSNPNLTVEQRIKVLEDRVVKLNDTLDRMLPALTRLASLEKDLSQSLSSITPASGSHANNAVTHSRQAIPSTYQAPPPAREIKGSIRSVRTGEHGTKTRLVLDATSKLDYSYSIDNQNLSMVIEIPYAAWNAMTHKVLNNSPVIDSYSVSSSSEGGVLLTVKLKAAINVLWASTLEPGSSSNHRIVFDLTRI